MRDCDSVRLSLSGIMIPTGRRVGGALGCPLARPDRQAKYHSGDRAERRADLDPAMVGRPRTTCKSSAHQEKGQ